MYAEGSPQVDPEIFRLGIPILGICYGCQLMAQYLGGEVTAAGKDTAREYGKTQTWFDTDCRLFRGLPEQSITWMSHGDYMAKVPDSFRLVAHSDACPTVGICDEARGFYGVQYHPEVNHTEYGKDMIRNFLYAVCHAKGDWTMGDYKNSSIKAIRKKVGDGKVLLALSGGVDSSAAAVLLVQHILGSHAQQRIVAIAESGGGQRSAGQVVDRMLKNNYARYRMAGIAVVDNSVIGHKIHGVDVVADAATAVRYICRTWVDEVLIVISDNQPYPKKLIDQLIETGVTIHLNLAKVSNCLLYTSDAADD